MFATTSGRCARTSALAICIMCCAAFGAAAQTDAKAEPRLQAQLPGDSLPAYPRLTLDEVIERALAVSPMIASGIGGVRNARSLERVARGAYLPTLTATSTASVTDMLGANGSGGLDGTGTSSDSGRSTGLHVTSYVTYGLNTTFDVFTGGRRRANRDVASATEHAAASTLDSANYTVRLNAELAFYEVIRAMDLVRVARSGLADADLLVRYTRDMLRAGTVTRSDVLRADLQSVTFRTQLLAAGDTLIAASYRLGWLAGANGPVSSMLDSASEAIRPLSLDDSTLVRLAVESSPSVMVATATVVASEAALRAARASYVPTIAASATYTRATVSQVATSAQPGISTRPGWILTVGSAYPLFDGYRRADTVSRAEVAAYIARVTAADARRSARANIARLLSTLRTTIMTVSLGTEAVRSATEDLRVQTARYRAGISTMLDVLTSQVALVQAGYNLAQARNQYHTTRAAIEALVGRVL